MHTSTYFVALACSALLAAVGVAPPQPPTEASPPRGGRVVSGPVFEMPSPCGQLVGVSVGVPVSFTIVVSAATGLPGNSVTLDSTPLPPGAVHNPPLPVMATGPTATATSTFSWTPTAGATLPFDITYTATDQFAQTTECTVTLIQDGIECYLFLGFEEITFPLGPEPDDVLLVLPLVGHPVTTTSIPGLAIPNHPLLLNVTIASQVGMFDPWLHPSNPLQMSNGLRLTIGGGTQPYGLQSAIDLFGTTPPALGTTFLFAFTIQ